MQAGLSFPDISPELFRITFGSFTFALRWYALAYIAGILIGWRILVACARRPGLWGRAAPFTARQAEEYLTWAILGIILGGRLGYVLFYAPAYYLAHPLEIPQVWSGGMSFHGGFLGVVAATALFARRQRIPLAALADAVALATPPGLLLGRLANFVNAELWGRPTEMPWGVIFPGEAAQSCATALAPCARHPSQLYEAGLEGLVLGLVLGLAVARFHALARPWLTTGLFFAGYGLARFTVEFFRLADAQYITPDNPHGHVLRLGAAGLTMGQLLSLPMVLVGALLVARALRRPARGG